MPLTYQSVIPPVPELGADRKLEPLRLREMRKRLENEKNLSIDEIEAIAAECLEEIAELCSGKLLVLITSRNLLFYFVCVLNHFV